jgi:hypothetical protein
MGTDSKLWNKRTDKTIYCDRIYNLKNDYVESKGLLDYLLNQGLPKYMIVDLCIQLSHLFSRSIYDEIISELEEFDNNDIFVLIDEHDKNY